jgi:hypothetical protein
MNQIEWIASVVVIVALVAFLVMGCERGYGVIVPVAAASQGKPTQPICANSVVLNGDTIPLHDMDASEGRAICTYGGADISREVTIWVDVP